MLTGVAISFLNSKLLWANQTAGTIMSTALNGNSQTPLTLLNTPEAAFHMSVIGNLLYWTTEGSNKYSVVMLYESTSPSSLSIQQLGESPVIYGITIFDENKRPDSGMAARPTFFSI